MLVERRREDWRRHDLQILQALIITMAGFWLTVFLLLMCIAPFGAPGAWPLLALPRGATGQKAPAKESDLWVSVLANGDVFVDERRATLPQLTAALSRAQGDVFVRVDRDASFGAVRSVVRAAQNANRRTLTFSVAPSRPLTLFLDAPVSCGDADVRQPIVIHSIQPRLGEATGNGGTAELELLVDTRGNVAAVRVVRGIAPAVDRELARAASLWAFRPAMRAGAPVPCALRLQAVIDRE